MANKHKAVEAKVCAVTESASHCKLMHRVQCFVTCISSLPAVSGAADAASLDGQRPHMQGHVAEAESQGLLSARAAVSSDVDDAEEEYLPRDEEDQSRHDGQPGTLARIMKRY